MKLESIIELINEKLTLERKRKGIKNKSFLILAKSIVPNDKFPAYKKFQYILWLVDTRSRYKVLELTDNIKASSSEENIKAKQDIEKTFMSMLIGKLLDDRELWLEHILDGRFFIYLKQKDNDTSN